MIHGRLGELATLDRVVSEACSGRSAVLVLRGEAGIGKSVLLDHAATHADGMRVLRGSGIETESELPFAGLHLLLSSHVDRIGSLPAPQARAIAGALGLAPAGESNRFLIGLAVLTLLSDLADEQPVLCLIDDAHWLDRASADGLLFAARRLQAESIALIFGVRDLHAPSFATPGLPELRLGGLDQADAAELLTERAADLPHHIRAHVLNEARGNPLALLELAAARREGRLPAPAGLGLATPHSRVQQTFADRIAELPGPTQALVLVAAADDTGDAALVFKAAARLGSSVEDLQPAEEKDLLAYADGRLAFRHPLIRAAGYQSAPLGRRLAAHQALADSLDGEADADRRAWHRAAVSGGPDEDIASALESSAERARTLGGYAAVAAAYERAASLSPDVDRRGRRLFAAAIAATDAGQLERGATLATDALAHLDDPPARAQAAGIRATLADEQMRPTSSHRILLDAATAVAPHSPEMADYLLFRSADTALIDCDLSLVAESARRAAEVLPAGMPSRAKGHARVMLGLAATADDQVADGVRALRELIELERRDPLRLREVPISQWWHELLGDDQAAHAVAEALVQDSRDRGAAGVLPLGLTVLARSQRHLGHHHLARASATEGLRVAADTDQRMSGLLLANVLGDLSAIEGDEDGCRAALLPLLPSRPLDRALAACSLSLLEIGLGRYDAVLGRRTVLADGANRTYTLFSLPDLIEAAARVGRPGDVTDIHAFYISWASHADRPWAQAVALRCRALLADDPDAGRHYAAAVELHERGGRPFERARTELLYGEWLRRNRRRAEARPLLRSAAEVFRRFDAVPWLRRAEAELRAAGEVLTGSERGPAPISRLTPQELQVARLAARGMTNRDIGGQLFLSPRTVGYHLSNVYPKLGVTSRADLRGMDFDEVA